MSAFNINRGSSAANPLYMQFSAGIIQPVRTVTANDTATLDDYLILADATAGAITETLPAGLSSVQTAVLVIKKKDSSANTVTISGGANTIDGQSSLVLYTQNASVTLQWNGSGWSVEAFEAGAWTGWTPAISAAGSMTVSAVSITNAVFRQHSNMIAFELYVHFTLGGTASNAVIVSMPPPPLFGNHNLAAGWYALGGSAWNAAFVVVGDGQPGISAYIAGLANWTLGSNQLYAQGSYRIW